jgi:sulfur carrier protein
MTIELNGERIELRSHVSVAELIERAGAGGDRRGVAVAVDGEVVPRSAWDETELREGQRVEVVGAIQGG